MISYQDKLKEKHLPIINFFKEKGFGSSMPILNRFSYLKPIDRCIILEKLFVDGIRNIYLLDKLVLAYVKIGRQDLAINTIKYARENGVPETDCQGLEYKLGLSIPNSISNIERIQAFKKIPIDLANFEITFFDLMLDLLSYTQQDDDIIENLNISQKKSIIKILVNVLKIDLNDNTYGLNFIISTENKFNLSSKEMKSSLKLDDTIVSNTIKEMDSNTKKYISQLMLNLYDDNWENNFSKMNAIKYVCKKFNISIQ